MHHRHTEWQKKKISYCAYWEMIVCTNFITSDSSFGLRSKNFTYVTHVFANSLISNSTKCSMHFYVVIWVTICTTMYLFRCLLNAVCNRIKLLNEIYAHTHTHTLTRNLLLNSEGAQSAQSKREIWNELANYDSFTCSQLKTRKDRIHLPLHICLTCEQSKCQYITLQPNKTGEELTIQWADR